MKHNLALHIFRRDLRLQDNTALLHALNISNHVIPCFILDTRQITNNDYKSNNALQFMIESLKELNSELTKKQSKLYIFYGIAEDIVQKLIKELSIDLVTMNKDYTPFSIQRDKAIATICKQKNIEFSLHEDALLNTPENTLKKDKTPYTVFTPYMRNAKANNTINEPINNKYNNYYSSPIKHTEAPTIFTKILKIENSNIKVKGGRKEGLKLLKKATLLKNYSSQRDYPAQDYTSHLSAHHKFGTISIRETYHTVKKARILGFINELYWRDFFTNITYNFPHVLGHAFKEKYDKIAWSKSKTNFEQWCLGQTGFPIVDAGMRELNTTGYMHNRVRMITASFLIKDLHINWKWGEKYFAQKLVDYDPAVNNGNWQWVASTGCDAQPYFRIFNPWNQQKKFDPECLYIKKWIPELKNYAPKDIHNIFKKPIISNVYPKPIIEHAIESKKALELFKKI